MLSIVFIYGVLAMLTCLDHGVLQQVQSAQHTGMHHPHCSPLSPMSQSTVYFLWKHTSPWLPSPRPAQISHLSLFICHNNHSFCPLILSIPKLERFIVNEWILTARLFPPSTSTLFPSSTNGNNSGLIGSAWIADNKSKATTKRISDETRAK